MSDQVLFFNQKTLEMRYVHSHESQVKERLKNEGWIENPSLVHMHHPRPAGGQLRDANIPVQDQKIWEAKGYYAKPTMIYHPKDGTMQVSEEDAKRAFHNGWYASPAQFPGNDIDKIVTPNVSKEAANLPVKRKGRPKKGAISVTNISAADVGMEAA